jgi:hypothetical protein
VETTSFLSCIHLLLLLPPLIHIRKPSSPVSLLCVLSSSNSDLQDSTLPSYILNALFFMLSIYALVNLMSNNILLDTYDSASPTS